MSKRGKPVDPDRKAGVLDVDARGGGVGAKQAGLRELGEYERRAQDRAGARELDQIVESMPGLTRMQRDRERISPRSTTDELGHPLMRRTLPDEADQRRPFSSRQKKARSKARYAALEAMPDTQVEAQYRMTSRPQTWGDLNDRLSATAGDSHALSDKDRAFVGQLDRSIQTAERFNDRGHVVYANVQLPPAINRSNIHGFVDTNLEPGTQVSFDRYTVGSHQLHETASWMPDPGGRVMVCEIETRRGAYLGHSDSQDDTTHLLPRAMHLEVAGSHTATYVDPDGNVGTRFVLQLRDTTPET